MILVPVILSAAFAAEALVRARLNLLPRDATRFYARPIVLRAGKWVNRETVRASLQRLGYQRVRGRRVAVGQYAMGPRVWIVGRHAFRIGRRLDPGGVIHIDLGPDGRVETIRDDDGDPMAYATLEPEVLGMRAGVAGQDRVPVSLADVPETLVDAVLTVEDQRFFTHRGVDVHRIFGAMLANLRAGRVVQGASTITQQLAKNLFLSPRRTPLRKLRELFFALVLERRYSKVQILEAYLNEVYLGQNSRGLALHGVGSGAQFYFGKDVSRLGLGESALVAGLIRGPSLYSPIRHPDRARRRRDLVLSLLRDRGVISRDLRDAAAARPLGLGKRHRHPRTGQYFLEYVAERMSHTPDTHPVGRREWSVFTTLDLGLQLAADSAVRVGLSDLEARAGYLTAGNRALQAALVALDPRTGEILAMVGGRDFGTSQFNRAVHAHRQPGSAFKPLVALAALEPNGGFTLATMIEDAPLAVETSGGLWRPANYDGRFRGRVSVREAIERSLNVPFARIGQSVGAERIAATAHRLGIESPLHAVPSLALGASEVTPLEMARAFGVLAAGGVRAESISILGILGADTGTVSRARLRAERVAGAEETYLVTSALQGVVERGTGRGVRRRGYRGVLAAKSGTTNDYRDAWFVGYTPTLAIAVWVGFDDGRSIGLPGSRAALPIFTGFLKAATVGEERSRFPVPDGIELAVMSVDRDRWGCRGRREVFLRGTVPGDRCGSTVLSRMGRLRREGRGDWRVKDLMARVRRRAGGGFR